MSKVYYPPGSYKKNAGKHGRHSMQEEYGNVYFSRPMMGKSSDVRLRNRMDNDYGKTAAPQKDRKGMYDSPLRTIRSPVP